MNASIAQATTKDQDLIPVFQTNIGGVLTNVCDARLLHAFLGVTTRFNDWIARRIKYYGFVENIDYITILKNEYGENQGFQPTEYILTLDMGKELSMVEKNDKGRQARKYFINCERLAIEAIHAKPPLPTYPTPEQRETLVNTIKQLSSITADLTKVVLEGDYIAKGEPEQEPTLSMPDYFPLLVFSKATLEHLAEKVDNAIKIKTAEERKKLIAKIHVLAKQLAKKSNIGVRFYDLETRKKELPVQYRNPENPSQTWRGRGIMPLWLQDKIANGYQKEDFKETSKEHDNV